MDLQGQFPFRHTIQALDLDCRLLLVDAVIGWLLPIRLKSSCILI